MGGRVVSDAPSRMSIDATFAGSVPQALLALLLLLVAAVFSLPLAWEREAADRPAGLRTFPVVAVGSAAFVLLGVQTFPDDANAQARIVQGLMTGIGFIGGGAILKRSGEGHVEGIATAATIWATGALGAAVAMRRVDIAAMIVLVSFVILRYIKRLGRGDDHQH